MEKPTPDFTIDDLVAQITKLEAESGDVGFTTREITIAKGLPPTNLNMSKIYRCIHDLCVEGKMAYAGKKRVTTMTNKEIHVDAWKLVKEEGGDA